MTPLATTVTLFLLLPTADPAPQPKSKPKPALSKALKKRATLALTAHTRILKEVLDKKITKMQLNVRKTDAFPKAKFEKAPINKMRLKAGDKLECKIRSTVKIPEPGQFAMLGVILTPGGESLAGSGGGVARESKYVVRFDQNSKMKTAGTHEVLFVLGAIRLVDRQVRVLDATVKKVTVE